MKQQARNASSTVYYEGVSTPEIAEEVGAHRATVLGWVRRGLDPYNTTKWGTNKTLLEHEGRCLAIRGWERLLGLGKDTLRKRLAAGESLEKALTSERNRNRRKGCTHANAKLNEYKVRCMRWLYSQGETIAALAACAGVKHQTASLVIRGKTWKHVT